MSLELHLTAGNQKKELHFPFMKPSAVHLVAPAQDRSCLC